MSDEIENAPRTYSGALLAVIGAALLAAIAGLVWTYTLNTRLTHQEAALSDANEKNVKLAAELRETNARLHGGDRRAGQIARADAEAAG